MADDRSAQDIWLSFVPEANASALGDRIGRRRHLPEFQEASVEPQVGPSYAKSQITARMPVLLSASSQTRETLQRERKSLQDGQKRLRPVFITALLLGLALLVLTTADLLIPGNRFINLGTHYKPLESSGRVLALLLIAIALMVASFWTRRWLRRDSRLAKLVGELEKSELDLTEQLETRLDFAIDRLLRLDTNARGENQGTLVLTPQAPDLVELETAEPADTPNISRLRELVLNASTSAFAISGPRGIGKSTLIRALTSDRTLFDVAAVVPAPVRYDPDALLRRIHSDLARAILKRHGAETYWSTCSNLSTKEYEPAAVALPLRLCSPDFVFSYWTCFSYRFSVLSAQVERLGSSWLLRRILVS
jgi:hypothetical protein